MRQNRPGPRRAFTLLEVLIAVAIVAGTIAVVLALLPGLARQGSASGDRLRAQHLPDALTVELRRLAAVDFDALAARVPVMGAPLREGLALVAAADDPRVLSLDYLPLAATEQIDPAKHYFLIECWRFSHEPLRFAPEKPWLALHVRVSWPYRLPGGEGGTSIVTPLENRSELTFVVSLRR